MRISSARKYNLEAIHIIQGKPWYSLTYFRLFPVVYYCEGTTAISKIDRRLKQGRREGGAGGALCPRASGSKGPHNWRILTSGLQKML